MAFSDILPYFRTRMESLGFEREHEDAFNIDNVGSYLEDQTFHLEVGSFSAGAVDHQCQQVDCPVTLRIFEDGKTDPWTKRDEAISSGQTIVEDIANHSNATSAALQNVIFNGMSMEPTDVSNDNSFILVLEFTAIVVIKLN